MFRYNDGHRGRGKLACVLIDMQEGFTNYFDSRNLSVLCNAQKRVLDFCVEREVPLLVLEYEGYGNLHNDLRLPISKVPKKFSFSKDRNTGFSSREFVNTLRDEKFKYLLLTGINASYCFLATAKDAVYEGHHVISAEDLTGDSQNIQISRLQEVHSWFRGNGTFYDTAEFLIQSLKR